MILLLVEVSHTDLSEVTWMVLVHVGTVVVLTTSKTTTTWMLPVLAYTTVTGGYMATTTDVLAGCYAHWYALCEHSAIAAHGKTYCFLVFVALVGIFAVSTVQCERVSPVSRI